MFIKSKKWISLSIIILIIVLFGMSMILYITDTYNIRHPNTKVYYTVPNQRVLIIQYLLKNQNYKKYDSYIFGSSRVGNINPLLVKNHHTYNMTYGEGIPHEHLLIIKFFLKNHFPLKQLIIGLDEFSYQVSFKSHDNMFGSKSHYLVTESSIFDFYKFYFFRAISLHDLKHIKNKFMNHPHIFSQIIYEEIYQQQKIYAHFEAYDNYNKKYRDDPRFLVPTKYKGNELEDTLNDIREIVELAKENNIKLHIFINPIHHTTYDFTNKKLLNNFRERLSHITSYYDFSQPSYITNDNAYWIDTSHSNQDVGKMILDKIYNKNLTNNNFGVFIEKEK